MFGNCSPEVLDALRSINWNHGKGDIASVESESGLDGVVTCKLQYGTCKARFTVKNNTVHFRGHQRKLPS
jgi:hypothetical protein